MTVPTPDVGVRDIDVVLCAGGANLDAADEAEPAPGDPGLKPHVGAGVGPQDTGHWAASA